jgi:hypothetical protein
VSTATLTPASRALATPPTSTTSPAPSPAHAAPSSDRIAARRRLLDISGLHLATLARVSPYVLSYAEKGHRPLSDGQRARIEAVLAILENAYAEAGAVVIDLLARTPGNGARP